MTDDTSDQAVAVRAAVEAAHRRGWAFVLASTVRTAHDLDLAEECVQEAYAAALVAWVRDGIPNSQEAWLITAAKRRAVDAIRRRHALLSKLPLLVESEAQEEQNELANTGQAASDAVSPSVPDERLRLIFMCCHPALAQDAQLALTLRLVCGLSTADIAHALLVSEVTMAARITRAKKKIAVARIPFRVPDAAGLPERLPPVLGVIHLLFTAGHTAPSGVDLMRIQLIDEAVRLARMLRDLMPDEPEVCGLLALVLVTDARRATRADHEGRLLRLEDQERSLWNRAAITEAHELIMNALRTSRPGRYALQAAIAALYAEAPEYEQTDWRQIVTLYDRLLEVWPSPAVALNRTVPLAMVRGPAAALAEVEQLERDAALAGYPYLSAIKADLLQRLGRRDDALETYRRAAELTKNEAELAFLAERIRLLL